MGIEPSVVLNGKPFAIEAGVDHPPALVNYDGEVFMLYRCAICGKGFYVRNPILFITEPCCGECS